MGWTSKLAMQPGGFLVASLAAFDFSYLPVMVAAFVTPNGRKAMENANNLRNGTMQPYLSSIGLSA